MAWDYVVLNEFWDRGQAEVPDVCCIATSACSVTALSRLAREGQWPSAAVVVIVLLPVVVVAVQRSFSLCYFFTRHRRKSFAEQNLLGRLRTGIVISVSIHIYIHSFIPISIPIPVSLSVSVYVYALSCLPCKGREQVSSARQRPRR